MTNTEHVTADWLGLVNLRKPSSCFKPIAEYWDRYNGGKVRLLAVGQDWVIVQWPYKNIIRKQRRSYFDGPRFKRVE